MIAGIDIGGTTTDIIGLRGTTLVDPLTVKADDPLASAAGALGKFVSERGIRLDEIRTIAVTGVGASRLGNELLGIPAKKVSEFNAIGTGGAYLSGEDKAVVVSMGTGTAVVIVDSGESRHWGGSGVGGGTLIGLAKRTLGISSFDLILKKAAKGRLEKVDLSIGDITDPALVGLPAEATASNFGKVADDASDDDVAKAIVNLVCQTIGVVAAGAARATGIDRIVLTGKMSVIPMAAEIFGGLGELFGLEFTIPDLAEFATAAGAAVYLTSSISTSSSG